MNPETTISYASVMGIKEDLDLVGDQYQWLGSLFYFGEFFLFMRKMIGRYADDHQAIWPGNIRQTACCNGYRWGSTLPHVSCCGGWF